MLIFIAAWSNCLRRKLLKVGAAESSLRQGGYHLELGSALVSTLPKRAFGEQSTQDWDATGAARPQVPVFHFERKGRMTKVSANCACASPSRHRPTQVRASHAPHIEKIPGKRVNANCSNACWLRWRAGNLTEIFAIAVT